MRSSAGKRRTSASRSARSPAQYAARNVARAALAHAPADVALHERAPEAPDLGGARARLRHDSGAAAIEIDHDCIGAGARLAEQQVLHVEIGVAPARVVETA